MLHQLADKERYDSRVRLRLDAAVVWLEFLDVEVCRVRVGHACTTTLVNMVYGLYFLSAVELSWYLATCYLSEIYLGWYSCSSIYIEINVCACVFYLRHVRPVR